MNNNWFPEATPESQGVPSSAILSFLEECEKERMCIDSLIVLRHGHVIAEGYWAPFCQGKPHRLFSAGKALVSTAILFAIDEGLLHLDDIVTKLLPESLPETYSERFDRMTLYHLLTMHTGHRDDTFGKMIQAGGDREKTFFSLAPEYEPGTHFMYNNGVPDMLAIILYKVTGKRCYEYLEDRLFKPLGMDAMHVGAYRHLDELPTMTISTRSLLKLTWLYANHGVWDGRQIISRELADMAGAYLVPSLQDPVPLMAAHDTKFGYGFQIWRNSVGGFRIDGGRGQFGIGIPEMDLVIAINASEQDQGALPLLVWKHITNRLFSTPIKEDPVLQKKLQKKLASLTWAEVGDREPEEAVFTTYRPETAIGGAKEITVARNTRGELLVKTDICPEGANFGSCNGGKWMQSPCVFDFPVIGFGSIVTKSEVTGAEDVPYCCAACREDGVLELHFRNENAMGGKIIQLDALNGTVTYMFYDDFARARRSSAVKHVNLDACARSMKQTVNAIIG